MDSRDERRVRVGHGQGDVGVGGRVTGLRVRTAALGALGWRASQCVGTEAKTMDGRIIMVAYTWSDRV